MTLAFSPDQPDFHALEIPARTLQSSVHNAIAAHTEFSLDKIITQDNRDKYTSSADDQEDAQHLVEVFGLMRQLNEAGLASKSLGQLSPNGRVFKQALLEMCSEIANNAAGAPITYVELGPEPVKTSLILTELQRLGAVVDHYYAVDINPKSSEHMENVLQKVIPGIPRKFITCAFEDFRLGDSETANHPKALITMLGFQEGNDHPEIVNNWLGNITRPGDVLLSESQLLTPQHIRRIAEFYAHPAMKRFSRIAFEQAIGSDIETLNRFFLLPVTFSSGETANVAILAEEFQNSTKERNLHVSNFCLKLTLEQYRNYRRSGGFFDIISEISTDDQTLHFQLSRRL